MAANGRENTARIAAILLLLVAATPATSTDEACSQCHAATTASHATSVHGKIPPGACSSCHGGAATHLSAPARGNIFNPARAERSQADATCLSCHNSLVSHARWEGNRHARAGLSCVSCHRLHSEDKSRTAQSESCYSCHAAVRRAQLQRSTHILPDDQRRAKMQCSECHDVHAPRGEKLLRAPRINALCESCHDDKRGPFLWEHGPVRENCMSCHTAHGSNNTHLLTMRVPTLCQSCHAGDPHTSMAPSSSSAWLVNRACVNCHQMVHGSNHPSGITLQR